MKKTLWICSILWSVLLVGVFIYIPIGVLHHLKSSSFTPSGSERFTIIFTFIILILVLLTLQYFLNFALYQNPLPQKQTVIFISVATLNPFAFSSALLFETKVKDVTKKRQIFKTFDLIIMGLMVGLYLLLDFIGSYIPSLPFFVSFSIQMVPLFFFAFMARFWQSFVVCLISALLVWFMPNNADAGVSYIAYLFDYFFPVVAVSIASLLKPGEVKVKGTLNKQMLVFQWFVFIFIPLTIGYFSKVMSGVLFWFDAAWGYNKWVYSIIYNMFNYAFDMITMLIIVPTICTSLDVLRQRYY